MPKKSPAYSVQQILKLQATLSGPTWLDYYGTVVQGDYFEDFVRHAHADLPGTVPFSAVYQSLQHLAGQELTAAAGDEASWRLAGNLHRLRRGVPVYPWKGQLEEESVPAVIEGVGLATRVFKRKGKDGEEYEEHVRGGWFRLLFMGGLPAGRRVTRFWSWRFARYVRVPLGFARWDDARYRRDPGRDEDAYPLRHLRQLVQMRFLAGLEADNDPTGPRLKADEVRTTEAMRAHNRLLLARRLRLKGFRCPRDWDRLCHLCPAGYESCQVACHRKDYLGRHCPGCGEDNRPFDPESPSDVCVDCPSVKS